MCFFLQVANQGRVADPNITKYNVKVMPVSIPPPAFQENCKACNTGHDYLYFEQSPLRKYQILKMYPSQVLNLVINH